LLEKLKRKNAHFRSIEINGIRFLFDISDFTAESLYFLNRKYEPQTTDRLLTCLEQGGVFIDVGANCGYFTILAGLRVGPHGKVYAFEPNPPVRAQLIHHVALNHLQGIVQIDHRALSDSEGSADFWVPQFPIQSGLASLSRKSIEGWEGTRVGSITAAADKITVPTIPFDLWIRQQKLTKIDLMKIDVEGAEHCVLAGMQRTLKQLPPRGIICETTPDSPTDQLLRQLGYSVEPLEHASARWSNFFYARGR